jgi:hypothetical protein
MNDERLYHWLAVRQSAVVPNPIPMTVNHMRAMTVVIGRQPGEETLWSSRANGLRSNYEMLFGFATAKERNQSFDILLKSPIKQARAEVQRLFTNEAVMKMSRDGKGH